MRKKVSTVVLLLTAGFFSSAACNKIAPPPRASDGPSTNTPAPLRGYMYGLLSRDLRGWKTGEENTKLAGFAVQADWAQAQLTKNAPLSPEFISLLDDAEDAAKKNNFTQIKLRLYAGINSPKWARELAGGPLKDWVNTTDGSTADMPVWFSKEYLDAYEDLMAKVAAEMKHRPLFKEVCCAGAGTVFAEPCIRQLDSEANRSALLQPKIGYTLSRDTAAIRRVMRIHHTYMSPLGIVSSVAYNPFQYLDENGKYKASFAITQSLMEYQAALMKQFGVWANYSLAAYKKAGTYVQARPNDYPLLYDYMYQHSLQFRPIQFQTASLNKMADFTPFNVTPLTTARYAAMQNAMSVEMPVGWAPLVTKQQADSLNNVFHQRTLALEVHYR